VFIREEGENVLKLRISADESYIHICSAKARNEQQLKHAMNSKENPAMNSKENQAMKTQTTPKCMPKSQIVIIQAQVRACHIVQA
jgi:hypothetical protein